MEEWRGFVMLLERVLDRVALTGEQLDSLLKVIPKVTSHEHFIEALKVGPQQTFWNGPYGKPCGFQPYHGRPEILIRALTEEMLMLPSAAYATVVHTAGDLAVAHATCLKGNIDYRRMNTRNFREGLSDYQGNPEPFTSEQQAHRVAAHEQLHLSDSAIALCRAALVLERHRTSHGAYPNDLATLSPTERDAFPSDWSRAGEVQPVPYRCVSNTAFTLHVAWTNQHDDHGAENDLVLEVNRP